VDWLDLAQDRDQCTWSLRFQALNEVINLVTAVIYRFYPIDKARITADCIENQFTSHYLCDYDHKRQTEARVQALLDIADGDTTVTFHLVTSEKRLNL
jgi:hypothetical protein